MKLLARTNRSYMLFTGAVLLVVGIALYLIITRMLKDEVSEKLALDRERVIQALEAGHAVVALPPIMVIDTLDAAAPKEDVHARDVRMIDPFENDEEPFHEVSGTQHINGLHLRITTRAVVLEPHDYLFSIGLALLLGSLLVLGGLWWVNRRMARTVWGAFHRNLDKLQRFDLRKDEAIALEASDINEFGQLNEAITRLTERIRADHNALKEFTGNASHEMQTPLAVLQAQLEAALGRNGMGETTATAIHEAHAQVLRLSRLHQGLLLLSRIENRQYNEVRAVNVGHAIEMELARHAERLAASGIQMERAIEGRLIVDAHPALVETLLANVIGNAVKHHCGNGPVGVLLSERELVVSNTGAALSFPASELFLRFRKADPASPSPGLGLSIAQSICSAYGWRIDYRELAGTHTVTIRFSPQDPSSL